MQVAWIEYECQELQSRWLQGVGLRLHHKMTGACLFHGPARQFAPGSSGSLCLMCHNVSARVHFLGQPQKRTALDHFHQSRENQLTSETCLVRTPGMVFQALHQHEWNEAVHGQDVFRG